MRLIHVCLVSLTLAVSLPAVPGRANEVVFRDDFESTTLESGWSILNESSAKHGLSERPGYFRIETQRGTFGDDSQVSNILVREMTGNFILDTKVEFDPHAGSQFSGVTFYIDNLHTVALGLAYVAGERGEFRGVVLLNVAGTTYSDTQRPAAYYNEDTTSTPNVVYLRLLRFGDQFVGAFSADGLSFTDLGAVTNALPEAVMVGVVAANGDFAGCGSACDAGIPADFDFFQITALDETPDDGPPGGSSGISSLSLEGPGQVVGGSGTDFTAIATNGDGVETDVTVLANWIVAPTDMGTITSGTFEAAEVDTVVQATLVATYTPDPSSPEESFTAAKVIQIRPPQAGSQLCGTGVGAIMPVLMLGLGILCRRR